MKQKELYQNLLETSEKLGIIVLEKNFRNAGVRVESGMCKIKGKTHIIIDKHKRTKEKNQILGRCISTQEIDDIYLIPVVRDYLASFG